MTNTNPSTRTTPSKAVDAEVGERIHMLMWNRKLTQLGVANAIGIDNGTLGRKLRGERKWALIEVVNVAAALETTVGYLLGEVSTAPVAPPEPTDPTDGGSDVNYSRVTRS